MKAWLDRQAGTILVVLAVLTGGSYLGLVLHEEAQTACQARYNTAFTEQAAIRAKFSTASDRAQVALLAGVSSLLRAPATTDRKVQAARGVAFRKLFADFDQATSKVEAARKAHPLPALPNC